MCLTLLVCLGNKSSAQVIDSTDNDNILDWRRGVFPKQKSGELYDIKINGFYRFFATHLYMPNTYSLDDNSGAVTQRNTLFIGDDSQLPNLLVNVSGRPTKYASWGFDVFAFQFLDGNIDPSYNPATANNNRPSVFNPLAGNRLNQNAGLNLGLNLYGSYITPYGTFNVRMGGIHWYSISDLTLKGFTGYNRFLLYERNPWDPIGRRVGVRYNQMYESGAVYQDLRFGERPVQGIIIDGINLPGGMSFSGMYGKTDLAGGFATIPNTNYGGKIKKVYKGKDFIAFNSINNVSYLDSLNTQSIGFNVHTVEWQGTFNGFKVNAEVGAGRYVSPLDDFDWSEAVNVKLLIDKEITKIPIELHYYRIGAEVVNNNAIFWNTTIVEPTPALNEGQISANALIPFASAIVPVGQMTNNRTGMNINSEVKISNLNVSFGYGVSTEIQAFQNRIAFTNSVNQLTRSRLWRWNFPQNVGPYGRYNVTYRDAFQQVELTDTDLGVATNPKKFTNTEIHAKYKTKIGYRNFYWFFLGRYNTAQPDFAVIPPFNEDAYLRQYTSETEIYYQVSDPLFINAYLGYERTIGNYQTVVSSETFRPLNQTGWGVGLGLDINISRNAGLYIRHRWVDFEDASFLEDRIKADTKSPRVNDTNRFFYQPQETLVELKVFF